MSSDEVMLWRWPEGGFWPKGSDADPQYIALPLARHAALMRVVEAARALLDLLAYEHPDFGYSEIADLRAALALPADAAGSAEAVRAACAAVPALEEARRRRLRWADEAHAQILAVPAQPAPEGAGEAVACLDCDAGHPRWVVPENGNVIHTLPGGMVNFCAAPSRPGGAA